MRLPSFPATLAVLVSCQISRTAASWPEHWQAEWFQQQTLFEEPCTVSHVTAYEMEKGREPVWFSTNPLDDFEAPKILPMNGSAGEQWEFDGVSEDGTMAFIFGFYRDPNYAFMGAGNLRLSAEFAFANGERYSQVDYPTESTIEICPHGTRGVWKAGDYSYRFEISAEMNLVRIAMDTPKAKGTIVMDSVAPPRYADNNVWPSDNATMLTVPHFYWVEPVPVATVTIDAEVDNKPFKFGGMGGHERLWGAYNWFTCLDSMTAVRLHVGPYALSYVDFGSNIEPGLIVPSVILAENGKKVFGSRLNEQSDTEDYMLIRKVYDEGGVTGSLRDKATGFELDLVSPSRQQQWSFFITHKNVGFEYFLGEGVGGTGYSGTAIGGPIGLTQWKGPGFTEILKFPQKSLLLKKNYVY